MTKHLLPAVLIAGLLVGCSQTSSLQQTQAPPQTTPIQTISTPIIPSPALQIPTETPKPTATPIIVPTSPPEPTPDAPIIINGRMKVKIFMIAKNDDGVKGKKIVCEGSKDSVVPVERDVEGSLKPIAAALNDLFALKSPTYSDYQNAVARSTMKVTETELVDGKVIVNLSGTPSFADACDPYRFEAQIRETVEQYGWSKNALIYVNGVRIEKVGR